MSYRSGFVCVVPAVMEERVGIKVKKANQYKLLDDTPPFSAVFLQPGGVPSEATVRERS